jgi:hypothetical protein
MDQELTIPERRRTAGRFLRVWVGSLVVAAVVVGAVNLLVDPYDVFGMPRIAGFNRLKPETKNHAMLAKTFQVDRGHPLTVLIGSSPVYIGLDAAAASWPAVMQPVYNYGIPGAYETSTNLRTLQEAISTGGVRNAVVFLDFQDFFSPEDPDPVLLEAERRFRLRPDGTPNPDRRLQRATDMFLSLGTMGALLDSVATVALQRGSDVLDLAPDGSANEADFINAARDDGMYDLFAQKDTFEAERARKVAPIMAGWVGALPGIDVVAGIIALARAHDVKLTLVIAPHHVDALEFYWRAGLWPRVEQLKRELAAVAADPAEGLGSEVVLWDFLDYSAFNSEPVPPAGDRHTATRWFWEPTHFKKRLGDIMVERMSGQDAPLYGATLSPGNVDERNARVRADRRALVCERRDAVLTSFKAPPGDECAVAEKPRGRS